MQSVYVLVREVTKEYTKLDVYSSYMETFIVDVFDSLEAAQKAKECKGFDWFEPDECSKDYYSSQYIDYPINLGDLKADFYGQEYVTEVEERAEHYLHATYTNYSVKVFGVKSLCLEPS